MIERISQPRNAEQDADNSQGALSTSVNFTICRSRLRERIRRMSSIGKTSVATNPDGSDESEIFPFSTGLFCLKGADARQIGSIRREFVDHEAYLCRSLVWLSGLESLKHTPSSAHFIITTSGFRFSIHTPVFCYGCASPGAGAMLKASCRLMRSLTAVRIGARSSSLKVSLSSSR